MSTLGPETVLWPDTINYVCPTCGAQTTGAVQPVQTRERTDWGYVIHTPHPRVLPCEHTVPIIDLFAAVT